MATTNPTADSRLINSESLGRFNLIAKMVDQGGKNAIHRTPSNGCSHILGHRNTRLQEHGATHIIEGMEYSERLKAARKHASLSQAELAKRLGINQTSISDLERGKSQSSTHTASIARHCGVNPYWLERGEGNMVNAVGESPNRYNVEVGPELKGFVPLISWVQAGSWCEVEDVYQVGDAEDWLPCPTTHGPRAYVLRVRGESMFNAYERRSFRDGDLIFCDPDKHPENGSMVIIKLEDSHEATFKQLVIEGDQRFLKPLNPAWPEPIIKINGNAQICGVVIGKYEPF